MATFFTRRFQAHISAVFDTMEKASWHISGSDQEARCCRNSSMTGTESCRPAWRFGVSRKRASKSRIIRSVTRYGFFRFIFRDVNGADVTHMASVANSKKPVLVLGELDRPQALQIAKRCLAGFAPIQRCKFTFTTVATTESYQPDNNFRVDYGLGWHSVNCRRIDG
jgi:hypothetical protein